MEDERKRNAISLVLIGLLLIVLGICFVIRSNNTKEEIIAYSEHSDSNLERQLKTKQNENATLEYQLKVEHRETIDQHTKLIALDNEQLAIDIVYIDAMLHTHYLYYLIEKEQAESTPYKGNRGGEGWPGSVPYNSDEYKELVKVFEANTFKKNLAISVVKEYLSNDKHELMVPDSALNYHILVMLSGDKEDEEDENLPKVDNTPGNPKSSYNASPSSPKKPSSPNPPKSKGSDTAHSDKQKDHDSSNLDKSDVPERRVETKKSDNSGTTVGASKESA